MSEHDADAVVEVYRPFAERMVRQRGEWGWHPVWDDLTEEHRASLMWDAARDVKDVLELAKPGDDLGNGLVAVPREPTEAMVAAGARVLLFASSASGTFDEERETALDVFHAMAAASEPTTRGPHADER